MDRSHIWKILLPEISTESFLVFPYYNQILRLLSSSKLQLRASHAPISSKLSHFAVKATKLSFQIMQFTTNWENHNSSILLLHASKRKWILPFNPFFVLSLFFGLFLCYFLTHIISSFLSWFSVSSHLLPFSSSLFYLHFLGSYFKFSQQYFGTAFSNCLQLPCSGHSSWPKQSFITLYNTWYLCFYSLMNMNRCIHGATEK